MALESINPHNGRLLKKYVEDTPKIIKNKLELGFFAQIDWEQIDFKHRSKVLNNLSDILLRDKEHLAILMAEEMGKILKEGRAEVEKCAWVCRYYADNAENFMNDEPLDGPGSKNFIAYNPLGMVLAIMPWNFPLWQVFRFAAPATMAGNTTILKHASNVQGCAQYMVKMFREAGAPDNLFQNLCVSSAKMESIIADDRVAAVTLTGSTNAGKKVAATAGSHLKKTVLELGGSDAYVVLADANLEKTVDDCVTSRLINAGQSCIAAKRFIVEAPIYDDFIELFNQKLSQKKMGNPLDETSDLGPQARIDLRDELHGQVEKSIEKGAKVVIGCEKPKGEGAYYSPGILANVKPGMPAFDEELFGPVAAIIKAENEYNAIELANNSIFGLGAAVFTNDIEKGEYIASRKLKAGCCFVNDFVKSDPRLPFGGIKQSGYGRELSHLGIREFVNIKTVLIK